MDTITTMQGNLVADPTQRSTASGAIVTHFRIASTSRRFDKATQEWRDTDPNFMSVSCWRQLAVHAYACLRKGDTVVVHGRLVFREYDDRANVRRREHELEAIALGPDLSRYLVEIRRPERRQPADGEATAAVPEQAAGSEPATHPWDETPVPAAAAADVADAAA